MGSLDASSRISSHHELPGILDQEGNPMKPISPKLPIKIRNSSKHTLQPIDPSDRSIAASKVNGFGSKLGKMKAKSNQNFKETNPC
jgi:hypothetical protein